MLEQIKRFGHPNNEKHDFEYGLTNIETVSSLLSRSICKGLDIIVMMAIVLIEPITTITRIKS